MWSIFKKNISYLISGLVFLAYAFYRLYQFYNEASFNPVRLIIALVFFWLWWIFDLHIYKKHKRKISINKPKYGIIKK